jgi:hypothetical protein
MKWFGKTPIGKDGFPVEFIEGSPVRNFIRLLRFTDRKQTARGGWVSIGRVAGCSINGTAGSLSPSGFNFGGGTIWMKTAEDKKKVKGL